MIGVVPKFFLCFFNQSTYLLIAICIIFVFTREESDEKIEVNGFEF